MNYYTEIIQNITSTEITTCNAICKLLPSLVFGSAIIASLTLTNEVNN